MACRRRLLPCAGLGLFGVLCWVWVSFASFPDDQLPLEVFDTVDRGAFLPQSAFREMEFASIASYKGPGNTDGRSNKQLPILLWWSAGLFPHFPGDTERIDCALSSCLVTSNRKVSDIILICPHIQFVSSQIILLLFWKGPAVQEDSIHHILWDRLQGVWGAASSSPPSDLGPVPWGVPHEQLLPFSRTWNQAVQLYSHLQKRIRLSSDPAVAAIPGLPAAACGCVPGGEEPPEERGHGPSSLHAVSLWCAIR